MRGGSIGHALFGGRDLVPGSIDLRPGGIERLLGRSDIGLKRGDLQTIRRLGSAQIILERFRRFRILRFRLRERLFSRSEIGLGGIESLFGAVQFLGGGIEFAALRFELRFGLRFLRGEIAHFAYGLLVGLAEICELIERTCKTRAGSVELRFVRLHKEF